MSGRDEASDSTEPISGVGGFDQTNGVVPGLDGDSDGTAEGEESSSGDLDANVHPKPVGQQDAFQEDHYGAEDGTDPNP